MATLSQFRAQFDEFGGVSDVKVSAFLAAAALEIDPTIWGAKADQGQLYLCAHKLTISPFGQNARMLVGKGEGLQRTTYGAEYERLVRGVSSGYRTF